MFHHDPVLVEEVLTYLECQLGRTYIDCTVGGGGHAARILEKSAPDGRLLGIDRDMEAIRIASERLREWGRRAILVHGNFSDIGKIAQSHGFQSADGVLMDLGVSSFQLDNGQRGFSFRSEALLDMRMDRTSGETASDLVNRLSAPDLERLLGEYGEPRWARRISRSIERHRRKGPIETTTQFTEIIRSALPAGFRSGRIDPATRAFMALRIAVNDELENLRNGLREAIPQLKKGARICVISFHSLEDRIVKDFFRLAQKGCSCPPDLPYCVCHGEKSLRVLTPKPLVPSRDEIERNPRARSARLRVAERI